MCGIFGVVSQGKSNNGLVKFFRDAAIADAVRGVDSFGILQVGYSKKKKELTPYLSRTLEAPTEITHQQTLGIMSDVDGSLFSVGHNRAATHGVVNVDNCHPFSVYSEKNDKTIYGVHNGSLRSWKKKDLGQEFEVDSQWALAKIAEEGTDFLKEIDGPFVFVWWDTSNPEVLNIARGTGRPIHLAQTSSGNILFASEGGMLSWLAERNNIPIVKNEILEVPENTLISLDILNPSLSEMNVSSFTPTKKTYNQSDWEYWDNWGDTMGHGGNVYPMTSYKNNRRSLVVQGIRSAISKAKASFSLESEQEDNEILIGDVVEPEQQGLSPLTVTKGSVALAEQLGFRGVDILFIPNTYDERKMTMYGEGMTDKGEIVAHTIMVNVDEKLARALLLSDSSDGKVLGVTAFDSPGDDSIPSQDNMTLFNGRPTAIHCLDNERSDKITEILNGTKTPVILESLH